MASISVDVDIDIEDYLDEVSDKALMREVERRKLGDIESPETFKDIIQRIFYKFRTEQNPPQEIRDLVWVGIGRVI